MCLSPAFILTVRCVDANAGRLLAFGMNTAYIASVRDTFSISELLSRHASCERRRANLAVLALRLRWMTNNWPRNRQSHSIYDDNEFQKPKNELKLAYVADEMRCSVRKFSDAFSTQTQIAKTDA